MYDISDVDRPSDFISKQLGLSAIVDDQDELILELLKGKSNEELANIVDMVNSILEDT